MSMSTHVIGFRAPGQEWHKMKAVYDACVDAEVEIPRAVDRFFDYKAPEDIGTAIDLKDTLAVKEHAADCEQGFDVDITKLPAGINIIRFYNLY
jgi:hypothetical protein